MIHCRHARTRSKSRGSDRSGICGVGRTDNKAGPREALPINSRRWRDSQSHESSRCVHFVLLGNSKPPRRTAFVGNPRWSRSEADGRKRRNGFTGDRSRSSVIFPDCLRTPHVARTQTQRLRENMGSSTGGDICTLRVAIYDFTVSPYIQYRPLLHWDRIQISCIMRSLIAPWIQIPHG
jgi:hypothetical protein